MYVREAFHLVVALLLLSPMANAQSIMFGAGAAYGSDIEQVAPNVRIYYGLTEAICFGPEYAYFPVKNHGGSEIQLSEYAFIGHYIFEINHKLGFYPLMGVNYSVEQETHMGHSSTNEAFGAAFGLGFHLNFKNFLPFAEYKYITGELSQSTLSAGLIYNLHLRQEKPEHGMERP